MGSSGNHIDTHLMLPYTHLLLNQITQRIYYGKFGKKEGTGEIYL